MPRWPEHGLSKQDLLLALHKRRALDARVREGHVFAGVVDAGDELSAQARHVYASYLAESAPAVHLNPAALALENDLSLLMKELLRAPAGACSNFTSGSPESILMACLAAREHARAVRGIGTAEVVLAHTAQPAFLKACHLLGMKAVTVAFDPLTYRADIDAMRLAITPNTALLVASAPCLSHGVLDDVPGIAALAQRHGIACHVDAALGGLYLSFMRLDRRHVRPFDLSVDGVTSLNVDLHKYGCAPRGAGMIVYRDKAWRARTWFASTQGTGYALTDPTALGSRGLAPLAGAWAALHIMGDQGYRNNVRETLAAAKRLMDGVAAMPGLRVLGAPAMCVMALGCQNASVFNVEDELRERGWQLQVQFSRASAPASLHLSVNRKNALQIDALLADLHDCVTIAAARPQLNLRPLQEAVNDAMTGEEAPDFSHLWTLLAQAGAPPHRWAPLHALLDSLPQASASALLADYLGGVYE